MTFKTEAMAQLSTFNQSRLDDQALNPNWHQRRKQSHLLARECINQCLQILSPSIGTLSYSDLEILNHHHLSHFPDWLVSLSHCSDECIAWLVKSDECLSVGIDLERSDRKLKERGGKYFIDERDFPFSSLETWVIKEACFKALSSLLMNEEKLPNYDLLLKQIKLEKNSFHHECIDKEYCGHFLIEKKGNHLLAKAWIT